MPEWVTGLIVLSLAIPVAIIAIHRIFSGLRSEAKRNGVSKRKFLFLNLTVFFALIAVITAIFMQEGLKETTLLVSPIVLALTLVAMQDFFNLQNSKQIEAIHDALKPENEDILKLILEQNNKLIGEIDSFKKENSETLKGVLEQNEKLTDEMNSLKSGIGKMELIIARKSVPETILIEDRRSLINFSSIFSKEK